MNPTNGSPASVFTGKILYFLYLVFFASIICAVRPLSSIVLGLMLLAGMIKNRIDTGSFRNPRFNNLFLWACFAFYFLQVVALLYTHDTKEGLWHLQVKSSLLAIPLAMCTTSFPSAATRDRLMKHYVGLLLAASCFCLLMAAKKVWIDHLPTSFFFYHSLVKPFEQHAIQFSILVFIGLVYLLITAARRRFIVHYAIHLSIIVFFLFFLLLLSSKLVISFSALCLLCFLAVIIKRNVANRWMIGVIVVLCLGLTGIVLLTKNPISARFTEIISEDPGLIKKESFTQGTAFNGLQFRILQWRFAREILNENKGWIIGVSPGDTQGLIDKKYIQKDMYIGDGVSSRGFLGYDSHNQFLESILQTGIIGLFVYILLCIGMIQLAVRTKDWLLWAVVLLLLAYSLNESVFETQYGLVLFIFFPLFFYNPKVALYTQNAD